MESSSDNSATPTPSGPASALTAASEVTCLRCGYVLHAPTRASRCPECGAAAALSIDAVRLHALMPGYLRRTSIGLGMVFFGALMLLLSVVLMYAFGSYQYVGPLRSGPDGILAVIMFLVRAEAGLGLLGVLVGWLLATSRPPFVARKLHSRRITRCGVIATGVSLACFIMATVAGVAGGMGPFLIGRGLAVLLMFAGIVLFYIGSLVYMYALSTWIPDPLTGLLVYIQFVVGSVAGMIVGLEMFHGVFGSRLTNGDTTARCAGVLYVGMWILYTYMTHRLWSQFRMALRDGAARDAG